MASSEIPPELLSKIFAEAVAATNEPALQTPTAERRLTEAAPGHRNEPLPQDIDVKMEILLGAQRECLFQKARELRQLEQENKKLRLKNFALSFENNTLLSYDTSQNIQGRPRRESSTSNCSDLIEFSTQSSPSVRPAPPPAPARPPLVADDKANITVLQPYKQLENPSNSNNIKLMDLISPDSNKHASQAPNGKENAVATTSPVSSPVSPARPTGKQPRGHTCYGQGMPIKQQKMLTAQDENAAVVLTGLPVDITYQTLLRSLATLKPGRIKDIEIKRFSDMQTAARIVFFTHEAALIVRSWETMRNRSLNSYFEGQVDVYFLVKWYRKLMDPSDHEGRSRILMVRGPPNAVNMASISWAWRQTGFNPELEDLILNFFYSPGFMKLEFRFRSVKDSATAKGIFLASMPDIAVQYLPDTCE